jgi:serine/arginine repetitive matrix protein 2
MYAGDSRTPSTTFVEGGASGSQTPNGEAVDEAGPAVEVIELANGETIW